MRRCSARRNSALARAHSSGFTGGLLSQQRMPGEAQRRVRRQTGAPQLRGSPMTVQISVSWRNGTHRCPRRPVIIRPVWDVGDSRRARVSRLSAIVRFGFGMSISFPMVMVRGRTASAASRCRAAKRRRIARPLFPGAPRAPGVFRSPPQRGRRSAERRHFSCPASARPALARPGTRRARPQRRARRLSALRRGDFGPRDRASGTRTAGSSPALSRGFRPARPVPSSPCGQPPVVGADGDPTPPGTVLARHGRGRRRPRSANMTPHESAL